MAHARKQIRDAVIGQINALTTTGSNCFASRVWPMGEDKLPGLIVYTVSESADITTMGSARNSYRKLQVNIEAHVKGANPDDTIDTIAAEIESALGDDHSLGGLVKDIYYNGIEIDLKGEGDKPIAVGVLSYVVEYQVKENNAEVIA